MHENNRHWRGRLVGRAMGIMMNAGWRWSYQWQEWYKKDEHCDMVY